MYQFRHRPIVSFAPGPNNHSCSRQDHMPLVMGETSGIHDPAIFGNFGYSEPSTLGEPNDLRDLTHWPVSVFSRLKQLR